MVAFLGETAGPHKKGRAVSKVLYVYRLDQEPELLDGKIDEYLGASRTSAQSNPSRILTNGGYLVEFTKSMN